jgi:hypothetical protein
VALDAVGDVPVIHRMEIACVGAYLTRCMVMQEVHTRANANNGNAEPRHVSSHFLVFISIPSWTGKRPSANVADQANSVIV